MSKNLKILTVALLMFICLAVGFIAGSNISYPIAYNEGAKVGYSSALIDVANLLQQKGITLDWNTNADGSYILTVSLPNGQSAQVTVAVNLILEHRRNGKLLETARGAGHFTTLGKNWTVAQLSSIADVVQGNTGVNDTQFALYLSDTADNATLSTSSTILPNEITANGLERALADDQHFVSTGVFNCTKTKTAGAALIPETWGLNYAVYADFGGNSLIAYDFTPGPKNMAEDDTLAETWTVTIS